MKPLSAASLAVLAILATSSVHAADDWVVRRASTSGACHVGKDSESASLGKILSTFPDAKSACQDAKNRKASSDTDAANATKCQGYTRGAIDLCKKSGVTL